MARGDRDRAIAFALSKHPDRIGVGRLCQELLAEVSGRVIGCRAEKPVKIKGARRPRRGVV